MSIRYDHPRSAWTSKATRSHRFQADGQILLYDIAPTARINVVASYGTPDPEPAS